MAAQLLLDFQRRHLESAGLEDVHAAAAQVAVATLLHDRGVPGAEPALPKGVPGRVGTAPVLLEHAGPPHLDFSRDARPHRQARLVHQPNKDPGKRGTDRAGTALAVEWVGERHAD